MEAMRESWTDDRLDDLTKRVDTGFAQAHEDIAALRVDNKELRRDMAKLDSDLRGEMSQLATRKELQTEIKAVRSEMREGFDKVDARFETRFDALNKRFDDLNRTLIAATLAGIIALLANHFG
jgi:chromosome segregation ATPase